MSQRSRVKTSLSLPFYLSLLVIWAGAFELAALAQNDATAGIQAAAKKQGLRYKGPGYQLIDFEDGFPLYYSIFNEDARIKTQVEALLANPNVIPNIDPNIVPAIDGFGFRVGLWDYGWARRNHNEFFAGRRVTIMDANTTDPNTLPFDDHATHVAGTIGAIGLAPDGVTPDPAATGMAPAVHIDSYDWLFDLDEIELRAAMEEQAYSADANLPFISTHPYGVMAGWEIGIFHDANDPNCPTGPEHYWFGITPEPEDRRLGLYNERAARLDKICYEAAPFFFLPFKAAGNDRDPGDSPPLDGTPFWYLAPVWQSKDPLDPNLVGYSIVARNWLAQGGAIIDNITDLDNNNIVDHNDLKIFTDNWLNWAAFFAVGDPNGSIGWEWVQGIYDSSDPNDPVADAGANGYDTIAPMGTAKNIMTVGAIDDNNDVTAFSAFGPTDDGRIKPDIVAYGDTLYSPAAASINSYNTMSGTSSASANAAGSAALLMQYYNELNFEGLDFWNPILPAAYLKALIIHTADRLPDNPTEEGPNYRYGWGLMDANEAAEYITSDYIYLDPDDQFAPPPDPCGVKIVQFGGGVSPVIYKVKFRSDNDHLRATLCWTDPPAQPIRRSPDVNDAGSINGLFDPNDGVLDNNSPRLVNDLDLRIVDPSTGTTYFPYVLDPCNPGVPAAKGDNKLDNVEQVYMPNPVKGRTYEVWVIADDPLAGGLQYYALVLSEPVGIDHLWVDDDASQDPVKHVPGPPSGNSDPAEDGSADHPFDSIQKAINAADADNITFIHVLDGTYTGIGNYNIDTLGKTVKIKSETGAANCVIDCQNVYGRRGFYIHSGETSMTSIQGLTIQNGRAENYGGGIYCTGGSNPMVQDCNIYLCEAEYAGGGVACDANSKPTIENCVIAGNYGGNGHYGDPNITQMGGGIYARSAAPIVNNCVITYNDADGAGGGIAVWDCNAVISNCLISDNKAVTAIDTMDEYGGGIYCRGGSSTIKNCVVSDNIAADSGGGIAVSDGPQIWDYADVNDVNDLDENVNDIMVWLERGEPLTDVNVTQIIGCKVLRNCCQASGGIYSEGEFARTVVRNTVIANNFGYWSGGMSSNYGSIAFLVNVTMSDNDAAYAYLTTSRIGGMECDYGRAVIANSILYGNRGTQLAGYMGMSYNGKIIDSIDDIIDPNFDPGDANDVNDVKFLDFALVQYSDVGMVDANNNYDSGAVWPGIGNINTDPLFAVADVWGSDPYDYHLQSHAGRYDPIDPDADSFGWVTDDSRVSPCIDSGNNGSGNLLADYYLEPSPNGGRVNMGAYGNSIEASKSP